MADDPDAAPADGDAAEDAPVVPREEVPDSLSLPLFFPNDRLADCTVRLPGSADEKENAEEGAEGEKPEGGGEGEQPADEGAKGADGEEGAAEGAGGAPQTSWRCHKVILASASDFFYRKFVIGDDGPTVFNIGRKSSSIPMAMHILLKSVYST